MPNYDYICEGCGKHFEIFQHMSDAKITTCPKCGKNTMRRLIGAGAGVIFHGKGFYCTDFKNSSPASSPSKK